MTDPIVHEDEHGFFCEIRLTRGGVALVDATDYAEVEPFSWYAWKPPAARVWYAVRGIPRPGTGTVLLHRQLMGFPALLVDHEDGNGLNCRRFNMRLATRQQNGQNRRNLQAGKTSRYLGVSWAAQRNKWMAKIKTPAGVQLSLGRFLNEDDAARAFDAAARLYFGAFASLNFPDDGG